MQDHIIFIFMLICIGFGYALKSAISKCAKFNCIEILEKEVSSLKFQIQQLDTKANELFEELKLWESGAKIFKGERVIDSHNDIGPKIISNIKFASQSNDEAIKQLIGFEFSPSKPNWSYEIREEEMSIDQFLVYKNKFDAQNEVTDKIIILGLEYNAKTKKARIKQKIRQ